jgi:hypothetical protein
MDDLDIEDWWTGSSFVDAGMPVDIPDISVSNLFNNLGNITDLSDAISFGDLSGIVDLGNLNYDYLSNLDYGYGIPGGISDLIPETTYTFEETPFVAGDTPQFDFGYGEGIDYGETFGDVLRDITPGISGFGEAADEVGGSLSGGVDYSETFGDVLKDISPGIEGFGEAADEVGGSRSGTYIPGIEGFGEAADEVGGSRSGTYIPGIEGFGEAADEVGGSRSGGTGTTTTTKTDTKTDTKKTDTVKEQSELLKTLTSKDNALLMALLGGLLGLLGKGSAPKGPVGYTGGIPKYTATRGTPTSPTAGGRRPGGAGIPSLTGGVTYQRAAQGGLMSMAAGGRPARYLRGGTDGMADKIKTDIDGKQPARLSHGEFVIPADVVSHLGNGNSDAGADVLYDMMDKIRNARTGTTKQGKQINPRKYTPA